MNEVYSVDTMTTWLIGKEVQFGFEDYVYVAADYSCLLILDLDYSSLRRNIRCYVDDCHSNVFITVLF